ncbi:MAG: hypothetical protein ACKOU6_06765 [Planctomycetota bacterium]
MKLRPFFDGSSRRSSRLNQAWFRHTLLTFGLATSALGLGHPPELAAQESTQRVAPRLEPRLEPQPAGPEFTDNEAVDQFVFQPAPTTPRAAPQPPERIEDAARTARRTTRNEFVRYSKVPHMLGDSIGIPGQLIGSPGDTSQFEGRLPTTDLPLAAGRSFRVAENNRPRPADRIYFTYHAFQNALSQSVLVPPSPPIVLSDSNVNLYTVGLEKTFGDGRNSVEVRVPMLGAIELDNGLGNTVRSGTLGDITLFLKHLLYDDSQFALAAGVGIGLPTASDITGQSFGSDFRIHTDAVHLMPYLGAMLRPTDDWFIQSFLQLDLATNGNPVTTAAGPGNPADVLGKFTEQNLLIANLSVGRWLYQREEGVLQGVAAITELHYTTSITDADNVGNVQNPFDTGFTIANAYNRVDVLNFTAGLHFQIGPMSNLRVACVTPLRSEAENRWFDSEILVSFNRNF